MGLVSVNSVDLATFGYTVRVIEGMAGAVTREYATDTAPHGVGETLLDDTPRYSARRIVIRGTLVGTSAADVVSKYRALAAHMANEPLDVTWTLEPDRFARGRLVGDPVTTYDPQGLSRAMGVDFEIVCHSPYLAANTEESVSLSTSAADCEVGTWDSAPEITVTGATTVTITYKDHDGTTQGSMTFTSFTAPLVVDLATYTATHNGGDNAMGLLTAGDFFLLRAADADLTAGAEDWPTLTLSAGTGTAVYRKRYR